MAWIKIDDQFADHPKVIEAGPMASWLYVCGLTYCGRYLTDGFIPRGQVRKLADVDNAFELAGRLVTVGLWEEDKDGYRVHDYLDYNPTGDKVKAEREANSRRQAEWRERNRKEDGTFGDNNAECNTVTNSVTNGVIESVVTTAPSPSPSPSPSPNPNKEEEAGASAPGCAPAPDPVSLVFQRWMDINPRRQITPIDVDTLNDMIEDYGAPEVAEAIVKANAQGKPVLAYIEGILKRIRDGTPRPVPRVIQKQAVVIPERWA